MPYLFSFPGYLMLGVTVIALGFWRGANLLFFALILTTGAIFTDHVIRAIFTSRILELLLSGVIQLIAAQMLLFSWILVLELWRQSLQDAGRERR